MVPLRCSLNPSKLLISMKKVDLEIQPDQLNNLKDLLNNYLIILTM